MHTKVDCVSKVKQVNSSMNEVLHHAHRLLAWVQKIRMTKNESGASPDILFVHLEVLASPYER